MKKVLVALVAAGTIGMSATVATTPAEARCVGCAIGAGVAAGVIGGALIAGAASRPYYGPAYVAGPAPGCYYTRERYWDGYMWRRGPRILVCS
ncbi:MAG: hypothetical protein ACXWKH_19700 [Limisphaerales bacterium]